MNIQLKNETENIYPIPSFPVGAIFKTTQATSPAALFGGIWTQIKDVFLYASSENYPAKTIGGKAKVTLSIEEMPAHTHTTYSRTGNGTGTEGPNGSTGVSDSYTLYSSTTTISTQSKGGGQAHENMPPYKTVYMWKKVGHGEPASNILDSAVLDALILG